eukprot:scaffold16963_cov131-Isochrysis_galbana.AAC.4
MQPWSILSALCLRRLHTPPACRLCRRVAIHTSHGSAPTYPGVDAQIRCIPHAATAGVRPGCSVGPYVEPTHPYVGSPEHMQCVGPSPTVPYVGSDGA